MSILNKLVSVTFSNGESWTIPISVIAESRALYYAATLYNGDFNLSLNEDTLPLFESDNYEIIDWAAGNMDWKDFEDNAILVSSDFDYISEWSSCELEVLEEE